MEAEVGVPHPQAEGVKAWKPPRGWEGGRGQVLPCHCRQHGPANTLNLDFWPPDCETTKLLFCATQAVVFVTTALGH